MVKDDRTWVHPNAIRRGERQKSGRYLHYFRHWHSFSLRMDDYRFVRWTASHDTNNHKDSPPFDAASKKLSELGWDALDKEEQRVFEDHQMSAVRAVEQQDGINFEGWGRLEGGIGRETITAFAVNNDPHWRGQNFDDDYEKTFRKVRVTILSSEEEHTGSMLIWGQSMREISTDDDDMGGDEDALYVEFRMRPETLQALARDVAAQPIRPTLTLHAQGLMFRDEVEAALSEIWHPREYVIIYDHNHHVILNSILFDLQMGARPAEPANDEVDDDAVTTVAHRPIPNAASVIPDAVTKNLSGLKHALWILAGAIIIAALIR